MKLSPLLLHLPATTVTLNLNNALDSADAVCYACHMSDNTTNTHHHSHDINKRDRRGYLPLLKKGDLIRWIEEGEVAFILEDAKVCPHNI